MSTEHTPAHESLIQAVVAGDLGAASPQVRERAESCAECRRRLIGLDRVRELLDELAAERRETLASLDEGDDAPGRDRVAPFLRSKLAEREAGVARKRRGLQRGAWLAAAALVALLTGWLWSTQATRAPRRGEDRPLGEHGGAGLSPAGDAASFRRFAWELDLPPGGEYSLSVWDAASGAELTNRPHLSKPECEFSEETIRPWPNKIRWRVTVLDATGGEVTSRDAVAERSR